MGWVYLELARRPDHRLLGVAAAAAAAIPAAAVSAALALAAILILDAFASCTRQCRLVSHIYALHR
jgi:hypothetical protein